MDPHKLRRAIGFYMEKLRVICPRAGMGSLLIKNHLMLHVPQYMLRWGPMSSFDTTTMERGHKTSSKRPAELTQQRPEIFPKQVASKYSDLRLVTRFRVFFKVDQLFDKILGKRESHKNKGPEEEDLPEVITRPKTTGSPFTLGLTANGKAGVKWKKRPGRQTHLQPVQDLVAKVILPMVADGGEPIVEGFTEYKIPLEEGKPAAIFRAHPSYRSASRQQRDVWYDWAMFDLSQHGFGSRAIPGQILMFVKVPFLKDRLVHKKQLTPCSCEEVIQACPKDLPQWERGSLLVSGQVRNYQGLPHDNSLQVHLWYDHCGSQH